MQMFPHRGGSFERHEHSADTNDCTARLRERRLSMKISKVEVFVLLEPDFNVGSTSSAQDDLVVAIHTDEGYVGYGEADLNPWIGRACIEAPGTHTMGLGLDRKSAGCGK